MKRKKIKIMLIVASDNLRFVLKDCLEKMNYVVNEYADGESAIRNYHHGSCDIGLIDIKLPKKCGFTVLGELHTITLDLPVIFITAKNSKADRIKGFQLGCEDYLTKPFFIEELIIRVETILRNQNTGRKKCTLGKENIFPIGDSIFNSKEMRLVSGEHSRLLTKKETLLLKLLYENRNRLVPKEILIKEIWGNSKAATGRSLDVNISKLRSYIHSEKVEMITERSTGYLLRIRDV
jgi:DNA-binding response OmpR family regulator